ncbi:hypothetical protein [Mycolicibacterium palauense]|uniref:hypothetical protein n=1 Tax=Mycolicibacterium palauense TaxID=2034511 RepID=UPI000BFEC358|nr:hypothetical protein [Mycolicibacterium palauense]
MWLSAVLVLADETAPSNTGPEFGKASPVGLLLILLLLIGTFFLVRSMNRHLKKLPQSFDRDNPEADRGSDGGSVEGTDKGTMEGTGDGPARDNGAADGRFDPREPSG